MLITLQILSQLLNKLGPLIMLHFADEKIQTKRSNLPEITQLFSGTART